MEAFFFFFACRNAFVSPGLICILYRVKFLIKLYEKMPLMPLAVSHWAGVFHFSPPSALFIIAVGVGGRMGVLASARNCYHPQPVREQQFRG